MKNLLDTEIRINLEKDVTQAVGIGILHMLAWVFIAVALGFPTHIDPLIFTAAIILLLLLHEGMHALPLLMWNIKPRFGYKRVNLIIFYAYTRIDRGLRLRRFLIVTLMPMALQPLFVAMYYAFPQYSQILLSLLLLNAVGLGGDIYLVILTLGCSLNTEIIDEGASMVVRGCRVNMQKRRELAYVVCFGFFYGFIASIVVSPALMMIAPITGSIPPIVYVGGEEGLNVIVNITALMIILISLFTVIGYIRKRRQKASGKVEAP